MTGSQIWLWTIPNKDPVSRVACKTLTTTNKVVLAGETRGPKIEKDELISKVRNCIKDIGYDQKVSVGKLQILRHSYMSSLRTLQWDDSKTIKMRVQVTKV